MYKCSDCGKQFIGGKRRNKSQVITDYIEGKQTLTQLAIRYNVSERTIRRDLTGMRFVHSIVLNERVHDKRIKRNTPPYMRPRLRSAYLSLRRNMPLLWTFYDHPETGLPNTNNGIEGVFSDLKGKLRVHRGISKDNRKKLLDEYILRHY